MTVRARVPATWALTSLSVRAPGEGLQTFDPSISGSIADIRTASLDL